jgi:pyruvate dehydrogenase E1 component alpha subunit
MVFSTNCPLTGAVEPPHPRLLNTFSLLCMTPPIGQESSLNPSLELLSPPLTSDPDIGVHAQRSVALQSSVDHSFLSRELGLVLFRDMVLGRRFEDKCAEMYYRGKMFGFVHLYNGQEAVSTGVIKASRLKHDWYCSTYRDHVHALSCGVPAKEVMSELFGKSTGCSKGRGGSMHLFSREHHLLGGYAFIGEGIPVALGAAYASRYKREVFGNDNSDSITAAFFGDGTCNVGQFYECLNMAQLWKLPILFVVENNKWAIGMDHNRATSEPEIWRKASAFGMHGEEVDGMDVLAVYAAAQRAIQRARNGEGPTLLECLTYRFRGHSLADPDELRSQAEKEFWAERDPIKLLSKHLTNSSLASIDELSEIEQSVDAEIKEAVEFALNAPEPASDELTRYIWA